MGWTLLTFIVIKPFLVMNIHAKFQTNRLKKISAKVLFIRIMLHLPERDRAEKNQSVQVIFLRQLARYSAMSDTESKRWVRVVEPGWHTWLQWYLSPIFAPSRAQKIVRSRFGRVFLCCVYFTLKINLNRWHKLLQVMQYTTTANSQPGKATIKSPKDQLCFWLGQPSHFILTIIPLYLARDSWN